LKPAGEPLPPWPEGIFETQQAPLGNQYKVANQWQGDRAGVHVQVFAGSLADDSDAGFLIVMTTSLDLQANSKRTLLAPSQAGGLRIIDAGSSDLLLASTSGRFFTFDLTALAPRTSWPSGIHDYGEADFPAGQPFPSGAFAITNIWQETIDHQMVRIFAGSFITDPTQGIVIIQKVGPNLGLQAPPIAIELSPRRAGTLRIEAVSNGKVRLVSAQGPPFDFEIAAGRFLE
jgi:hypothetical protein